MKQETKIENLLQAWQELARQQKSLDEQIKAIKGELQTIADENGMTNKSYFVGKTLKSRYDDYTTDKFNKKLFEQEHADLYNKYLLLNETRTRRINNPELI